VAKKKTVQLSLFDMVATPAEPERLPLTEPKSESKASINIEASTPVEEPTQKETVAKKVSVILPNQVGQNIISLPNNATEEKSNPNKTTEAPLEIINETKSEIENDNEVKETEPVVITPIQNENEKPQEKTVVKEVITANIIPTPTPAKIPEPIVLPKEKIVASNTVSHGLVVPTNVYANTSKSTVTKNNRGRKAQQQLAQEAQLVQIPADEILNKKLYYSIGDVAKMFNANVSQIRFWEEQFAALLKVRKNRKGDRLFSPQNIRLLEQVHFLTRVQQLSINGALQLIQKQGSVAHNETHLRNQLLELKQFLLALKAGLD
jgi:DNA-binding transcriptional MerR regulator